MSSVRHSTGNQDSSPLLARGGHASQVSLGLADMLSCHSGRPVFQERVGIDSLKTSFPIAPSLDGSAVTALCRGLSRANGTSPSEAQDTPCGVAGVAQLSKHSLLGSWSYFLKSKSKAKEMNGGI